MTARSAIEGQNVACLLWQTADDVPHAPAIIDGDEVISYGQFRARAAALAEVLSERIRAADRVGVFLSKSFDAAAVYFALQAIGAVPVVLNETLRPRQLSHILSNSGASVLLTTREMLGRLAGSVETPTLVIDELEIPREGRFEPIARAGSDLAQLMYTSGSTGLPKGVMLSHGGWSSAVRTVVAYLGLNEQDRTAGILPFSSVYGTNQLLCAVASQSALILERSPLPSQIASNLRKAQATVLAAVPPLWTQLLNTPGFVGEQIPTLRILQNAGGHLPRETASRVRQAFPQARLFLQYGMTEVIRSTFLAPEEVDRRPTSMGRAMPGSEVLVLREDLTLCEPGEVGELVHSGPTVALGYWNDPERTAAVFRPHPLDQANGNNRRVVFSGDLVRRDEEGFLYYVGRRDRIIKTLGYKVGPDEVLDALLDSGFVLEGVIDSEPDPARGERIIAHVVLGSSEALPRVEAFCRSELPRHMQPARFVVHTSIPRSPNGKYDLHSLRNGAAVS